MDLSDTNLTYKQLWENNQELCLPDKFCIYDKKKYIYTESLNVLINNDMKMYIYIF